MGHGLNDPMFEAEDLLGGPGGGGPMGAPHLRRE